MATLHSDKALTIAESLSKIKKKKSEDQDDGPKDSIFNNIPLLGRSAL